MIIGYRGATYYIKPYSEGDLLYYWNRQGGGYNLAYAAFDLTTDGVQKIGELALYHMMRRAKSRRGRGYILTLLELPEILRQMWEVKPPT